MIQTPTRSAPREADGYWEAFDDFLRARVGREPDWLEALRREAIARFAETGFPTTQDEDWRFTNVSAIARRPFSPLTAPAEKPSPNWLANLPLAGLRGTRLVFVDGHFASDLSRINGGADSIRVLTLESAIEQQLPLLARHLGRHLQGPTAFSLLNTAFFTDGVVLHVPEGRVLREPVHLVHVSTASGEGPTAHPRHLIVADPGSEFTVMETYVSHVNAAHLTNVVLELVVGAEAHVEHFKFQDENPHSYHVSALHIDLGRQSNLISHSFVLGASLSRNNIRTVLGGEGIECVLNGLYLTTDDQVADHHMVVDHASPHCNSHEYFNGILDGRSRGVFHGRILVRQPAQKTDAKQTNKNLLLSDDAGVTTKPQLEIYADDVKCTHGATIGQLDDESIFYLRARGIGCETARRMLMHAFAGEIIDRVRFEPLRQELDSLIWDRLEQNRQISVRR